MSETLISVERREDGYYYVNYQGQEFALLSPIRFDYDYNDYRPDRQWGQYNCSFSVLDMPEPVEKTAPRRRRKRAEAYGLRRPK